ncbi:DoxX family protein [Maricaulaceae bacterium EIL42A08]|nr:DoxX family protein [Maricaulaceae bacterium EIL42A08]MCP2678993.1 DoxX family protein [Maricaulaceae bacterium NA33B04]
MIEMRRFRALFADAEADGSDFSGVGPVQRVTATTPGIVDLIVGAALRLAFVVQFYTWARANAQPVNDPFNWRDWLNPSAGLETAVEVWTLGRIDPGFAAFVLLAIAMLFAVSLGLGLFTRVTALLIGLGVVWHMVAIAPYAWPQTLTYVAMALALVLRGGGAASIDWILSRLTRFG